MNIAYYIKDYYTLNNFLIFRDSGKLKLSMSARSIKFKMFTQYDKLFDPNKIQYTDNSHVFLSINYDSNLKQDGYKLKITKDNNITIDASNERSIRYAISMLNQLIEKRENDIYLPIVTITDEPSIKIRGIIEGFYGIPWSHENRLDVIKFMDQERLNAYIYAPKDDEYHRSKWRIEYPENKFSNLAEYKKECDNREIDFYYSISPGNDFDYLKEDDFKALYKKLDQVIEIGVKNFALLMDDINYQLSDANKNIFKRPGIAHAYITNKINDYLKNKVLDHTLIMCPTEYHQNWDSIYRNDLKNYLDKNITIFYTGDNVCAEVIDNETSKDMQKIYNHPLAIWENYPVNDFIPSRIFLAPITNMLYYFII